MVGAPVEVAGLDIRSQGCDKSKKKVIRVESKETQDYVREEKSTEFEEEEERTFIPSAVSVPPMPLFRRDKQCREKTLSCWRLASVVVNEGDEAYTTNLRQKCFSQHLQAIGEEPLTNVQWRQVVEKKAYRGRMWKMMGKEPHLRGMWECFLQERNRVKRFRQLADEEKQAGIQGQWQQESPAREYLEQVQCCHDTDCNEPMMKKGFTAIKNGTWEEDKETFRKKMIASKWAFDRIKEAFELVVQGETENMSIVQEIMLRSTDICGESSRQLEDRQESKCFPVPALQRFPSQKLRLVVSGGKTTKWCAICGEMYDWRQPNRLLVVQTGDSAE